MEHDDPTDMNDATNTDDIAAAWVAREDRQVLAPEALRERDAWLAADPRHRGAYLRAQAVFLRAGRAHALGRSFTGTADARETAIPAREGRRKWLPLAAAGLLVAMLLGQRPLPPDAGGSVEYATGVGEVLRVPLQDGSVMTLNSGTRVQVRYRDEVRLVTLLDGETLVDVAKDPSRPFVVRSGTTDVVAVGTSYSVRKGAGETFEVLVKEGVVDIRQPQPWLEPLRVHANFMAVSTRGRDVRIEPLSREAVRRRMAWREGLISFEGDTLAEAVKEFSRYSDVRILIDDPEIAGRRVVGVYSSADPEGFAKAVADSFGLKVETSPDGVHLRASQ